MPDVTTVNSTSSEKPLPSILCALSRSPLPSAIEASGAPPPPTICENAEIRMIIELVTPIPASASVPISSMCPMKTLSTMLYSRFISCAAKPGSAILSIRGSIEAVPSRSSYLLSIYSISVFCLFIYRV